MGWIQMIFVFLRSLLRSQSELAAENLVLRQQLAVLEQRSKRPRLRNRDRIFWSWIPRLLSNWRSVLVIVQPDTVLGWHRQGFRLYWRWRSRGRSGRPKIDVEIRKLIRRMSSENPLWGTPRIRSELRLLGYEASKATVAKYKVRHRRPMSQTWRTFLDNHARDIVAVDFFTVPTATFRPLFCFIVLRHHRRMVVHFNTTAHPMAEWTAQQIVEAFPEDHVPRFLIRDRYSIHGAFFQEWVKHMGIEQVLTAYRSPWQLPYVERIIGAIRRECLDHLIVLNERRLLRILRAYFDYYHHARAHLSLDHNSPVAHAVEPPDRGRVIAIPHVGGLHHRYQRAA